MAEPIGEVYVEIKAELKNLRSELNKIKKESSSTASKIKKEFESSFSSIGKFAGAFGIGFGVMEGVKALTRFLGDSVQAAKESAIAQAKVAQAVRTTGGAAGYTTKELKEMAAGLQKIAGIDDDKILNDVTLQLLTFTNISGTSFKRAQAAALDLSAVLGSDLLSQTIQLGKALEDPVKGITALQRVGITFTETQKAQIAQFMSANDLMSAQSLILTEIEAKYGGQAAVVNKASGASKDYNVALGELQETIGEKLKPVQDAFLSILTDIFSVFTKLTSATKEANSEWDIQKEKVIAARQALKEYNEEAKKPKTFNASVPTLNTKIPFFNVTDNLAPQAQINSTDNAVKKAAKQVKQLTEEEKKAREEALRSYYNTVRWEDKNYREWYLKQIDTTGLTELQKQALLVAENKKLDEDYLNWRIQKYNEANKTINEQRALLPEVGGVGEDILLGNDKGGEDYKASIEAYKQAEADAQISRMEVWQAGNQAVQDGFNELFSGLQLKIKESESGFVKMAKTMVNSFTSAITQMIAKYAAFQLLSFAVPGVGSFLSAHSGGTFQNGRKIAAFANGGSFTVPNGFPNDSYPMLVESGERVKITPSGRAGDESKLLARVVDSIQALNVNLMNKNMQPIIVSQVDGLQFVPSTVAPAQNRLNKAGVKLDAIR
jgi:hypothetical protein